MSPLMMLNTFKTNRVCVSSCRPLTQLWPLSSISESMIQPLSTCCTSPTTKCMRRVYNMRLLDLALPVCPSCLIHGCLIQHKVTSTMQMYTRAYNGKLYKKLLEAHNIVSSHAPDRFTVTPQAERPWVIRISRAVILILARC